MKTSILSDNQTTCRLGSHPSIDNSLIFKLADSQSDLEQAFRLVAQCYLEKGYMTELDSKLRIKLQHLLPDSAIFVGKLGDRIVATSSIFPDSTIGLPSDSIFQVELDELRSSGRRIAELGSLASNLADGTSQLNVPYHILQALRLGYLYSRDHLKVDDLIIAINPKHQFFYEKVLLFEIISETKFYPEVNQAPAIAMRQNFHTIDARLAALSEQKSRLKATRDLFFGAEIDFLPPDQPINVWNPQLLNYFLREKTTIFQETPLRILRKIQLQHDRSRKKSLNDTNVLSAT